MYSKSYQRYCLALDVKFSNSGEIFRFFTNKRRMKTKLEFWKKGLKKVVKKVCQRTLLLVSSCTYRLGRKFCTFLEERSPLRPHPEVWRIRHRKTRSNDTKTKALSCHEFRAPDKRPLKFNLKRSRCQNSTRHENVEKVGQSFTGTFQVRQPYKIVVELSIRSFFTLFKSSQN